MTTQSSKNFKFLLKFHFVPSDLININDILPKNKSMPPALATYPHSPPVVMILNKINLTTDARCPERTNFLVFLKMLSYKICLHIVP